MAGTLPPVSVVITAGNAGKLAISTPPSIISLYGALSLNRNGVATLLAATPAPNAGCPASPTLWKAPGNKPALSIQFFTTAYLDISLPRDTLIAGNVTTFCMV